MTRGARACGLVWLAIVAVAAGPASAEPVPGWSFASWSATPSTVEAAATAAKLTAITVNADDAAMYGLPGSAVPFAFEVAIYGQPAVAYPIFRDGGLVAVRFVVSDPGACRTVLDGLTADFGPGAADQSGFANINWPPTDSFGLTVVVTPSFCWPLFSRPGV